MKPEKSWKACRADCMNGYITQRIIASRKLHLAYDGPICYEGVCGCEAFTLLDAQVISIREANPYDDFCCSEVALNLTLSCAVSDSCGRRRLLPARITVNTERWTVPCDALIHRKAQIIVRRSNPCICPTPTLYILLMEYASRAEVVEDNWPCVRQKRPCLPPLYPQLPCFSGTCT